jgi:hypothetical protein
MNCLAFYVTWFSILWNSDLQILIGQCVNKPDISKIKNNSYKGPPKHISGLFYLCNFGYITTQNVLYLDFGRATTSMFLH